MKKQKIAIHFAIWVFENSYELTYQDLNNDGRVWTCHLDNDNDFNYKGDTRYTIEEIYSLYLIEKNNGYEKNT
jgi:hypothetical protein